MGLSSTVACAREQLRIRTITGVMGYSSKLKHGVLLLQVALRLGFAAKALSKFRCGDERACA
jgi:hypothetical protein